MKRLITLCLIALGMTLGNIGQANAAGKKDGMKINYVLKNIGVNREVQAKLKPLLASYLADKRNANKEYDSMKAKLEPSINSGTITEKQAQRLLDLKWQAAEKEKELTIKLDEAKAVQEAEIAKQAELAQKRQEEIDAKTREAAIQSEIEGIKLRALELGVEANAAVEAYNLAISEGYELTTAYNVAQARLNQAVEARAEAEETAAKDSEGKGGKGGSVGSIDRQALVEAIAEGSAQGVGGTTVNTSVNAGEVGGGVDKSGEVITLGGLQREVRDDQREARNHADQIKQSSAAMRTYLEGRMSPDVANKFAEKIMQLGLTRDELDTMVKNAINSQLIGAHDMREQFQNIKDMKNKLEKMGLK